MKIRFARQRALKGDKRYPYFQPPGLSRTLGVFVAGINAAIDAYIQGDGTNPVTEGEVEPFKRGKKAPSRQKPQAARSRVRPQNS